MQIQIDEEFKSLIPPLTPEERAQLQDNLIKDGCRDPLVVWNGTLIDGHNRYEICTEYGIDFETVEMDFADKTEAMDWIDANQLGRRNVTPDVFRLLLGRLYNRKKKAVGAPEGNENRKKQTYQNDPIESTADTLAKKHGVSAPTVKRAGAYQKAAEELGIEKELMSGKIKSKQSEVVHAAKEVAKAPEPQREQVKQKAVEKIAKPHVANNSGNNEWYTPPEFIEAARRVMGGINLDPATSEIANKTVKADRIFTAENSGLDKDWSGCVWMNPPYAQPLMNQFAAKMAEEVKAGNVSQSITLVNNATETGWFSDLASVATCICFPRGRVKFLDPQGNPSGAPLQGQAIFYAGPNREKFFKEFSGLGLVMEVMR